MQTCMLNNASVSLSRDQRILKRRDFLRVQRFGVRGFSRSLVVISRDSTQQKLSKFGITVPKKVGPAHVRNKIKRRIRHILRHNQDLFSDKLLVIVAKEQAATASFTDLQLDLTEAIKSLRKKSRPRFQKYKRLAA